MAERINILEVSLGVVSSYEDRGFVNFDPCADCALYDIQRGRCLSRKRVNPARARAINYCVDHEEVEADLLPGLFPGGKPASGIDTAKLPEE